MKKILLAAFAFCTVPAFSQVNFQHTSLAEAMQMAKAQNKLIFVQLESPFCEHCNEVATKGLSDKELSTVINQTFVPLYIDAYHKDRLQVESYNYLPGGFGILFLDQNGALIHKHDGSTSNSRKYRNEIDIAMTKAGESIKLYELEKAYQNNPHNLGLLEQILLKKRAFRMNITSQLDEYVSLLPADSLASVSTLQFIAGMTPVLNSKADSVLRKDKVLFHDAWYRLPEATRIAINHSIADKSMIKAILAKDENYAMQVPLFIRRTNGNKNAAEKLSTQYMLRFYQGIGNHAKFFSLAIDYYDRYYLKIDLDSAKRIDKRLQEMALSRANKDTARTNDGYRVQANAAYAPYTQRLSWDLQEVSRYVYKRTNDPKLLLVATTWIEKALAFYESHEAYEVYALLLYKQNKKQEAMAAEEKTIALKKKEGFPTEPSDSLLTRMKNGEGL